MFLQTTRLFAAHLALATISLASAQQDAMLPDVKHCIDTHIHLYDTTRDVYSADYPTRVPWPPQADHVLFQPHLPAAFRAVAKPAGVTGVLVVEASPRIEDNDWVLDLVKGDDFFVGLIGHIDPFQPSFGEHLNRLRADPRLVGIRVHFMNRVPGVSRDPRLIKNLQLLAQADLALDVLMNAEGPQTVAEVANLAQQVPSLRIVVNHVLGYNIDGKSPNDDWLQAIELLAKQPNVSVKISGLYQRSVEQPAPQDIAYYQPLLDRLWNAFGDERLMYGSNWPVTRKSGDYESFMRLVSSFYSDKGQAAQDNFFWGNASRAYNLKLE